MQDNSPPQQTNICIEPQNIFYASIFTLCIILFTLCIAINTDLYEFFIIFATMIDTLTIINFTAIGFYEAVLITGAIRLLRRGEPNRIQKIFCAMFFYTFIVSTPYLVYFLGCGFSNVTLAILNTLNTSAISFLPLTAYALMQKRLRLRHYLICFCPMLPEVIIMCFLKKDDYFWYTILDISTYIFLISAYIFMLFRLRKWDKEMLDVYSDVTEKQTVWYQHTGVVMIGSFLLWIPLYLYPNIIWIWPLYCMINSVVYFIITEYAIEQEVFNPTLIDKLNTEPEIETPNWVNNLNYAMNTQRIFCKSELDLTELSKTVGVNRTYLSKYINQTMHTTFYEFINDFRLKEACDLLKSTNDPIETIAQKCGFRSRTTLLRNFTKKYGMSPTEWRNKK